MHRVINAAMIVRVANSGLFQGPYSDIVRPSACPHLLHSNLLGVQHLESSRQRLSKFHGRLYLERNRRWSSRGRSKSTRVIFLTCAYDPGFQTAQPTVIADVMFLHERGGYNTLYFTVYFGSLMVRSTHLFGLTSLATGQILTTKPGRSHYCRPHD